MRSTPHSSPFQCATVGMERVVLGAHDGVMSWTLRVGAERTPAEQRLVSVHERLHHDLHQSSPWGLAMSAVAAAPGALHGVLWRWLAEGCRATHEAFATYFSAIARDEFAGLLDGNAEYSAHFQCARALGEHAGVPERWRNLIIDAMLRAAMAPRALVEMDLETLQQARLAELHDDLLPDWRLSDIEAWLDHDGARSLEGPLEQVQRDELPGLPGFRDRLASILTTAGIPTMTVAEHEQWGTLLTAQLNAQGHGRFTILANPDDPFSEAFDDYQRERLRLHDMPLPLHLVTPDDPGWEISWLARAHETVGPHAWLTWMRADLLAEQFDLTSAGLNIGSRPVLGFLAVNRVHGEPAARMWHFSALSPALVASHLREQTHLPVVFFTTLATILDTEEDADFRGIEPAFVLIDQPLQGFLERTRERGAVLKWRVSWLEGDHNVAVFILAQDHLASVYFLLVTSRSGYEAVLAWLLRQPIEHVAHDAQLADGHVGYLDAVLQHLIGSFYEIHLFAGGA
jgi:hypothetical protein